MVKYRRLTPRSISTLGTRNLHILNGGLKEKPGCLGASIAISLWLNLRSVKRDQISLGNLMILKLIRQIKTTLDIDRPTWQPLPSLEKVKEGQVRPPLSYKYSIIGAYTTSTLPHRTLVLFLAIEIKTRL
jgi:hypothetical protein